jgi:hypothetical protein
MKCVELAGPGLIIIYLTMRQKAGHIQGSQRRYDYYCATASLSKRSSIFVDHRVICTHSLPTPSLWLLAVDRPHQSKFRHGKIGHLPSSVLPHLSLIGWHHFPSRSTSSTSLALEGQRRQSRNSRPARHQPTSPNFRACQSASHFCPGQGPSQGPRISKPQTPWPPHNQGSRGIA